MSDTPKRGGVRGRGAARGRGGARGALHTAPSDAPSEPIPPPAAGEANTTEVKEEKEVKKPLRGRGGMRGTGRGRKITSEAIVQPKLTLKEIRPVFLSSFGTDDDECPMCRMSLNAPCSECQDRHEFQSCPIAEGKCKHKYHVHCINRWLQRGQNTCPFCQCRWERC